MLSCGLGYTFSFRFSISLRNPVFFWGVLLRFVRIFKCGEPGSVVLLLRCVRSEKFVPVGSQIGITFRNYTEDCHVNCFDKLGLIRSDYAELGNLCIRFD